MMSFGSFLAKAHKTYDVADWVDPTLRIPPLKKSHIFLLGDDQEFNEALKDIDEDLRNEIRGGLPMPFNDIAVVTKVTRPMEKERVEALNKSVGEKYLELGQEVGDLVSISKGAVWVMDRLILTDEHHPAVAEILEQGPCDEVLQWFIICRTHGVEGMETQPLAFAAGFAGVALGGALKLYLLEMARPLANEFAESIRYIAAISHPANYIMQVKPKLTPHEEKRVAKGKEFPREKTPHFIVVDHDVIYRMRGDKLGTHASPVPHERRGHWRRLAERCRHAKLMKGDKVFVRPTFVGERVFSDDKNLYEVLLDFGKKSEVARA